MVVALGECRGRFRIFWQQREEMFEPRTIEPEPGRELPQKRAQFLREPQYTRGKKVGERRLDVMQLLQVRDIAAALDREDEAFRGILVPPRKGIGPLQRIMRAADLDRADLAAGAGKLVRLAHSARIERAALAAVAPAGDADPHRPAAAHHKAPQSRATRAPC